MKRTPKEKTIADFIDSLIDRAYSVELPPDIGVWINEAENFAACLNDNIPQKKQIGEKVKVARRLMLKNDDLNLRLRLLEINQAVEDARDNQSILFVNGHSHSQSVKAQKPRDKINENGETIGHIIERLARQDETAADLWQQFENALRENGADPRLERNNREPRKSQIIYTNANGAEKPISMGRFETRISEARKKLSR